MQFIVFLLLKALYCNYLQLFAYKLIFWYFLKYDYYEKN